jgi:hypothetical protein
MLHPVKKWGGDAGQGADNTLSTLAHTRTLNALLCRIKDTSGAVFARYIGRVRKVVVARWPSVFVPCLQIRLAQFDSGSRLQIKAAIASIAAFCLVTQLLGLGRERN